MKTILPLTCFAVGAMAQGIAIGFPPAESILTAGQTTVVQIIRHNHIQRATEIGVGIGLATCPGSICPSPLNVLGAVLYAGPFNPEFHGPGEQYQNFTVQIPPDFTPGPARFQVARAFLIGAGPGATFGDASQRVNII